MAILCSESGLEIGLAPSSVTKAPYGVPNSPRTAREPYQAAPILQREWCMFTDLIVPHVSTYAWIDRKIWDTFSGEPLHSFPHNHIVRTVAISRTSSHILTGGQEKKVRIFDLARPDAEADLLGDPGTTPHDKTVKSVVWVGEHTGVSAGEDGIIKCVSPLDL